MNARAGEPSAAMPARPVAVLGADGFIGSHLSRALGGAGHPVERFTSARPAYAGSRPAPGLLHAGTVVFAATRLSPAAAEHDPDRVHAELRLFAGLLRALRAVSPPPRVVLLSSGGTVYSPLHPPPYREEDPVAPNNAYGRMKAAMERMLLSDGYVEPVVARLSNVYGPGQRARRGQGVIAHWLQALSQGQPPVVHGAPGSVRDYLYVADAVDALVRVHDAGSVPAVLNVGSGVPVSLADLARLTCAAAGLSGAAVRCAAGRPVDRHSVWLETGRARAALGWSARTPLTVGLARTWSSVLGGRPPAAPAASGTPAAPGRASPEPRTIAAPW